MPDIHVYVNRPSERDVPALEGLEDVLRRLEHVSEVSRLSVRSDFPKE